MSSYLTIYAKLKNVEKPAPIISWSRNNKVYQAMSHGIAYIGNEDKMNFTELGVDLINESINDVRTEMKRAEKYLAEYEKRADKNEEYINYIVETKDELEECENAIHEMEFIKALIDDISYTDYIKDDDKELSRVEKYLANID